LTLGRWFTQDDTPTAVISDAVWERKFQRASDIVGQTIESESQSYTIVGVAQAAFGGAFAPMRTDIWVPLRTRPRLWARIQEPTPSNMLMVFARLSDDVTGRQATAELNAIDARLTQGRVAGQRLSPIVADVVQGLPNRTGRDFIRVLTSLLGAVVGVVLLIACANVGHLLLARGALRRREFAMRRALGASRPRLIQQLLVEAVLLAVGGAGLGIVLAAWTNRVLQSTLPASIAVFALHVDVSLDWRALVFTSLVAIVAAVTSGLSPALRASDVRPDESVQRQRTRPAVRRRPVGVVAQVVMSMMLLFVAVGFLQGLDQLQRTAPGFEVGGRLYAHTALPSSSGSRDLRQSFYRDALERLRSLPGVDQAAVTSILPLIPAGAGCVSTGEGIKLDATASEVGPGYFGTLGIPFVVGQDFTQATLTSEPASVIVHETLARRAWPNDSPIGKGIDLGCGRNRRAVVAGVVGDSAVRRIGEAPSPHVYRQIM
jgi:predicted permease